jgi:hypothetical protein
VGFGGFLWEVFLGGRHVRSTAAPWVWGR